MNKGLENDLKNCSEYDMIVTFLKEHPTRDPLINAIFSLCEYAYEMGEAQGHYDATGDWKS